MVVDFHRAFQKAFSVSWLPWATPITLIPDPLPMKFLYICFLFRTLYSVSPFMGGAPFPTGTY